MTYILIILGVIGVAAFLYGIRYIFKVYQIGEESWPGDYGVGAQNTPQDACKPIQAPLTVKKDFSTPRAAFHSVRVMCDDAGLTYEQKNEICYTIWRESEFQKGALGKPNKNGTRDYGICQFNDGKNARGIPFWIGKGATFSSINEVLNDPEKCVRIMIQTYKAGNIGWWYGHKGYTPAAAKASPMWKLA